VKVEERTYCPVSGVVFQVKEGSAHREVGGRQVYFCCERCAMYFDEHAEHVSAARNLLPPR
jgi:YHS domain-containing protein